MNKGLLLILTTAIISGFSIFLNAFGVKGLNPFAFTGAKNVLVTILLISTVFLFTKAKELKTLTPKQWGKLTLIGLLGGSIPFLLFFKGLSMGSGATGAFIHKTMIAWVVIGAAFYLKEKLNWKIVLGATALLIGNFLVLNLNGIEMKNGLGLIILATIFWSAELLLSKKMLADVSGTTVAFGRMGIGSVFILGYLVISGHAQAMSGWGVSTWGWVALTSALLFGYVMTFYNGLKTVRVTTAVAILSLGSVITTTLQLVFLEKTLVAGQIAGYVLLIVGAGVFWWAQEKISKAAATEAMTTTN